jgi:hypothetical protein
MRSHILFQNDTGVASRVANNDWPGQKTHSSPQMSKVSFPVASEPGGGAVRQHHQRRGNDLVTDLSDLAFANNLAFNNG